MNLFGLIQVLEPTYKLKLFYNKQGKYFIASIIEYLILFTVV